MNNLELEIIDLLRDGDRSTYQIASGLYERGFYRPGEYIIPEILVACNNMNKRGEINCYYARDSHILHFTLDQPVKPSVIIGPEVYQ